VDLAIELQKIYDSEINVRIGWFSDNGIDVRLGDDMNEYLAEANVASVTEIVPWLKEAAAHFYPTSTYTAGLGAEVTKRASRRRSHPPRISASVGCLHCGAPNATMMDEVSAFCCPQSR
jgi:hypothetical protein